MPSIWITSNPRSERSDRHPFLQPRRRQRDKTPGGGRFRQTRAIGRRHVALGQAHRTFELARRDVDQHLVHGPFTEPVFRHRPFPTGKGLLLAVEATKPRTRDLHLAAVETDLALRLAPAMRRPVLATPMARAARRLRIVLHHLAKRLKPSGKAKPLEARRHARQRFDLRTLSRESQWM